MADPIRWPELIVLMAFGPDGPVDDTLRGIVHSRQTWPLPDDVGAAEDEELDENVDEVVQHPELGRLGVSESTQRIVRRGDRVRVERPDGTVQAIFGAHTTWLFDDSGVPATYDAGESAFGWVGADVLHRPPPSRWEGADFTRLTGPIAATQWLGRPAWTFELAPPAHKPYPVQMTIDARTGIVLREGNRDFGSVSEWVELEFGADLPDELFTYTGPTRDPRVERDAKHEADMAQRRAWLDARGIGDLPIPVEPELLLHDWHDDGAFHVSVILDLHASLLRRPGSADEWDEVDAMNWPHVYRWSDERWDWCLAGTTPIGTESLARLKVRLATTT